MITIETDERKQFISNCPPFDVLNTSLIETALRGLQISYHRSGTLFSDSSLHRNLFLVRSGSLEVRDQAGNLIDRLSSGDYFGHVELVSDKPSQHTVKVLEDCLLYQFSENSFFKLRQESSEFDDFFTQDNAKMLHRATDSEGKDYRLNQPVSAFMTQDPLCVPPEASILDAARLMTEKKISSLLVTRDKHLLGIVTDRDLRSRVLADNVPSSESIEKIMSHTPRSIRAGQSVHEAQLMMMSANVHHLPVVDNDIPVGILTVNDLIRAQNSEPIFLIKAINRATSQQAISEAGKSLPDLVCKMIRADVRADEVGRIITTITDTITHRLVDLYIEQNGEPPCSWAWLSFGSQARKDQILGSDQDNALIIEDKPPADVDRYFSRFTQFVNEGLDKAGNKYCPGGIMAMNQKWRQPLANWKNYFSKWIFEPDPKALMHASIFYDLRHVTGDKKLTEELTAFVSGKARENTIFLARMMENALHASPPLGFFKTFVLEKDGNHNQVLDLKLRGTVPIVSLVRLYALAEGVRETNTKERLQVLQYHNTLSQGESSNLLDAHEFIAGLRLENQMHAVESGRELSNSLDPNTLSALVRHQLKDAFAVVRDSQQHARMRFGYGAL
jgi:CBS domain-containing protein